MVARRPSAIKSISDFDEPKNILVYGDAGVGKTPFGASCPKSLLIATEPGAISAKRLGYTDVDVWYCHESWDEFVKAFRWLHDNPDHGYQWVVVDNATQLQEIMLRSIVERARATNSKRDEDIPAIQDYQKWYLMFDRFVKALNALPVNVLWLAHTMRRVNDEGEDLLLPAIQGQDYAQATKFCGRMMAIGFLEQRVIKKGDKTVFQNRVQWRKTQTCFAKDRYLFRKDVGEMYTIASEGRVMMTDMAEISRRIDAALKETVTVRRPAKSTSPKKSAAKKVAKKKGK